MAPMRIYLDYNASAPLLEPARAAMLAALDACGNPSSVHAEGRNARKLIEDCRSRLAMWMGVEPKQVIFTSGASEAAGQALSPMLRAGGHPLPVSTLYVSAVEHPCVLSGGRFAPDRVRRLPVDANGIVDPAALDAALSSHEGGDGVPMVAVMLANNETGVIQPAGEIAEVVHRHNGIFVVDAVQALGRIPFDMTSTGANFLFVSSHKIGGPKGVGALILGDATLAPEPMITGGGQENFHRAGTENTAAIAGFAGALATLEANNVEMTEIAALRDSIEAGITTISREAGNKAGEPVFFGNQVGRLANTSCFSVPGISAETALIALDLAGIAVSSGSACSSGKVRKSHVLEAMGVDDNLARCALRISTGPDTTREDAEAFLGAWKDITSRAA